MDWYSRFDGSCPIPLPERSEFSAAVEAILPDIPYIGGNSNFLTAELLNAAAWLTLWRLLNPTLAQLDELMAARFQAGTKHLSDQELAAAQANWFSARHITELKQAAACSQLRRYPGDWVFEVREEHPQGFTVTYTECGICKFLHQQKEPALAPLFCKGDYRTSALLDLGLFRTQTIANGDPLCALEYKPGRKTCPLELNPV